MRCLWEDVEADGGDRTRDLLVTNQVLGQLSFIGAYPGRELNPHWTVFKTGASAVGLPGLDGGRSGTRTQDTSRCYTLSRRASRPADHLPHLQSRGTRRAQLRLGQAIP